MEIKTVSVLTCPYCQKKQKAKMPLNACQHFYRCISCKNLIKPKIGDCCVFCSYGDIKCPPKQMENKHI